MMQREDQIRAVPAPKPVPVAAGAIEVVQIAEDRYQLLDYRGRIVHATGSALEAEAFAIGYRTGRDDAAQVVRNALEGLPARVQGIGF